jgi:putative heme iron utilization protein
MEASPYCHRIMKIPLDSAIQLLHAMPYGTLATNTRDMPGYPFATVLPFVPDAHHCPLFLISGLAEHTKNLLADPRASLLVVRPDGDNVQTGARMTLVGDVLPVAAEPELIARSPRYAPEAKGDLELGDFGLVRLVPRRVRLIAGFGKMGWLDAATWDTAAPLSAREEAEALAALSDIAGADRTLLGLDRYGVDLQVAGQRRRLPFTEPALDGRLLSTARAALEQSAL